MRMNRATHHGMLLMLGVMVVCFALPALAQVPGVNCSANYPGLTNKVAGCIRETISGGAAIYFAQFYPMLEGLVGAAMTLAVLLYGGLMAMGMVEKIGRDSFMLVIKLGAVAWFCASGPLMFKTITDIMDSASAAVVTYTPASGTADAAGTDFSQSQCLQQMIEMQSTAQPNATNNPVAGPWLAMDCLLDTVIGINIKGTGPFPSIKWFNEKLDNANPAKKNDGPSRALLYFLFSNMQTSIVGFLLAVIGFIFIYGFLMVVVKALFTYIAGYMGIAFLIIVSPLFIPLVLFTSTKGYFDKWVKLLISFALQPIIMLVFIILSLTAIDLAVFSGQYSIMYRIAGDESQGTHFDLNAYLVAKRIVNEGPPPTAPKDIGNPPNANSKSIISDQAQTIALIKGQADDKTQVDPTNPNDAGGVMNNMLHSNCTQKLMDSNPAIKKACSFVYPIQVGKKAINWEILAAARVPAVVVPQDEIDANAALPTPAKFITLAGQQIMRELLASTLFCGILVFILNGLLAVVPMVAYDLMGDFGQSANLGAVGGVLPGGKGGIAGQIGQMGKSFSNKAQSMVTRR